jgi:hypothetical protein
VFSVNYLVDEAGREGEGKGASVSLEEFIIWKTKWCSFVYRRQLGDAVLVYAIYIYKKKTSATVAINIIEQRAAMPLYSN